jgi:hypothetical protein
VSVSRCCEISLAVLLLLLLLLLLLRRPCSAP